MSFSSKQFYETAIHTSMNIRRIDELAQLLEAKKATNVLSIERTNDINAHKTAFRLIEQAAAVNVDKDTHEMTRFKEHVASGIQDALTFKMDIYLGPKDERDGKTTNYLVYGNENIADLQSLMNGKMMMFAGVIKFYS